MKKANLDHFYVVTCVSNPVRYRTRYELYRKFKAMCESANVKLITVEMAFGGREFEVTERDNLHHIQLRSIDELWHKENMLNLAINYVLQIDPQAREIAWVDADVTPMRPPREWFEETWHALQHYEVVQMFESAHDLDPNFNQIGKPQIGFMNAYIKSGYQKPTGAGTWALDYYTRVGHPGYAWAANITALNHLGGLIDTAILGAGDRHMALGLIGCIENSVSNEIHPNYMRELLEWQERAKRYIRRDVGYVPGSIAHFWHGKKKDRGYSSRWKILIENQYDPTTDLKRDAQGLYQLESFSDRQLRLRDQIRSYFRARSEDSIDV